MNVTSSGPLEHNLKKIVLTEIRYYGLCPVQQFYSAAAAAAKISNSRFALLHTSGHTKRGLEKLLMIRVGMCGKLFCERLILVG